MEQAQIALKLLLDASGIGTDISSVDRRKAVQKTIYIIQESGINLGYHYNWYVKGPYSPRLTRDYYAMDDVLDTDADDSGAFVLQPPLVATVRKIETLLSPPPGVNLQQADWLELVASAHYLLCKRRKSRTEALSILSEEKPHVSMHFDAAVSGLSSSGLLPQAA